MTVLNESQLRRWATAAREATEHRDKCVRDLRADGVSLRKIAEIAGLSHSAIARILAR